MHYYQSAILSAFFPLVKYQKSEAWRSIGQAGTGAAKPEGACFGVGLIVRAIACQRHWIAGSPGSAPRCPEPDRLGRPDGNGSQHDAAHDAYAGAVGLYREGRQRPRLRAGPQDPRSHLRPPQPQPADRTGEPDPDRPAARGPRARGPEPVRRPVHHLRLAAPDEAADLLCHAGGTPDPALLLVRGKGDHRAPAPTP